MQGDTTRKNAMVFQRVIAMREGPKVPMGPFLTVHPARQPSIDLASTKVSRIAKVNTQHKLEVKKITPIPRAD